MTSRYFHRFIIALSTCFVLLGCDRENRLPDAITENVSSILLNTARVKCKIINDAEMKIEAVGCCWSINEIPTVDDDKLEMEECGGFSAIIEGLEPNTKYYVRAYTTTSKETTYGNTLEFETMQTTVKDIEGNVYNLFQLGNVVITKENLRTTKYNNGDPILNITDAKAWENCTTGARCAYNNNESNAAISGYLYNWYATNDSRGICPAGWCIPEMNDWILIFNMITDYYKKQLEEYNFSVKAGLRFQNGEFSGIGTTGRWWSSTQGSVERALFFPSIEFQPGKFSWSQDMKQEGMSVRFALKSE